MCEREIEEREKERGEKEREIEGRGGGEKERLDSHMPQQSCLLGELSIYCT